MKPTVFGAAVTPFDAKGKVDFLSLARLFAYFEAAGCDGVVLAGTTGEGPSLSAVEKRDLIRESQSLRGSLRTILGLATSSLDEAIWLSRRADEYGAEAVLAMCPTAWSKVSSADLKAWYLALMDASACPVMVYHHPALTTVCLSEEDICRLSEHLHFGGIKVSSGFQGKLDKMRRALPEDKPLWMGDERCLLEAWEAGWSGTISGAANILAPWIAQIAEDFVTDRESAAAKQDLIGPVLEELRRDYLPPQLKAVLAEWKILDRPDVRLPLQAAAAGQLLPMLGQQLGLHAGDLGLRPR